MTSQVLVSDPLKIAAARALRAHHALGRLSACSTSTEFSHAAADFLDVARGVSEMIARYGKTTSSAKSTAAVQAFSLWLDEQVVGLRRHPIVNALTAAGPSNVPTVYVSREDFFFEGADKYPAIELCAEYLDRVTHVLDEARMRMKQLDLAFDDDLSSILTQG